MQQSVFKSSQGGSAQFQYWNGSQTVGGTYANVTFPLAFPNSQFFAHFIDGVSGDLTSYANNYSMGVCQETKTGVRFITNRSDLWGAPYFTIGR